MSATSITTKNKESLFNNLQKEFFKEGKTHLAYINFNLGKDCNKDKLKFQYQYLKLLCNFNCDIEYYFNEKLKNELGEVCKTILNKCTTQ